MRTYRYLSEFTVGEKFTTLSRTVTETDVVLFAGITGDMNPIHTDRSYADSLPFHSRIAHGLLGAGIATGLWGRMGLVDGSAIAALSTEWKFVGAIKLDDLHPTQLGRSAHQGGHQSGRLAYPVSENNLVA